jgi:hypothetical protein
MTDPRDRPESPRQPDVDDDVPISPQDLEDLDERINLGRDSERIELPGPEER